MSCLSLSVSVSGSDFDPLLSAYYKRNMQVDVDYSVSVIHGGITNLLYLIDIKADTTTSATKLILRVYGAKTDEMIDRRAEIALVCSLDGLQFKGVGFHALFENGRIEKHISGRALEPAQMTLPQVVPQIARSIARLHAIGHHVDSTTQALFADRDVWATLDKFLAMACLVSFPDHAQKADMLASIQVEALQEETEWLKNRIQSLAGNHDQNSEDLLSRKETGYKFALDKVLVHGDLLSGNILLDNTLELSCTTESVESTEDGVSLIDFEYSTYSARAYDLGNHFCECCGFDFNLESFPNEIERETFLALYLKEYFSKVDSVLATRYKEEITSNAASPSLKQFHQSVDEVVMHFTMLCSLFWSTWSLSLAGSKPDAEFNYLEYSKIRRDSYYYFKEKVMRNDESSTK